MSSKTLPLAIAFFLLLPWTSNAAQEPDAPATSNAEETDAESWVELKGGLRYRDLATGDGAEARNGSFVQVHYTGWLPDGQEFDSSRRSGRSFGFALGQGQVIEGWERGVVGMRAGGKRELLIPAKLAYGRRGVPGRIPPNTDLRFEIELVAVSPPPR